MSDDPPSPRVATSNRQPLPVEEGALAELARRVLADDGLTAGELSISFVGEAEMAELHERYLGEPGPTDVLSFPQDDPELLGDVIVCPGVASRQNRDLAAELRLLVTHGTLHILGYDHDDEEERARMWERQERHSGVRVPLDAAAHMERA
ncbi:MAG TPA: rRNA maturation RNase YbeY [Actinomycetota bacterium]|nr:rRNA maturation RNase YbeY [Actinomycetota bacterium]